MLWQPMAREAAGKIRQLAAHNAHASAQFGCGQVPAATIDGRTMHACREVSTNAAAPRKQVHQKVTDARLLFLQDSR